MRFLCAAMISATMIVAGCAGPTRLGGSPNVSIIEGSQLPPPTAIDLSSQARPYLVGPFDRLSIEVFGIDELHRNVQVDASGQISLPLAGTIDAAGTTPAQLEEMIEQRLRGRYLRDPQVTVNLTETISQVVTVEGSVTEPGLYPVIGRTSLMQAIARAKGTSEFARLSHVVVFRTVGGQRMAALYDLRAIQQGAYDDPEIFANDVVVVGESQARRLFRDVIQSSGLLMTPIVALLQRN